MYSHPESSGIYRVGAAMALSDRIPVYFEGVKTEESGETFQASHGIQGSLKKEISRLFVYRPTEDRC